MKRDTLIDRLLKLARPQPVHDFAPPPRAIDVDLWSLDRRLRMPGGALLPARTTIVRLPSRGLLVISPPAVEVGGLEQLDALGTVEEVLAPNTFHYVTVPGFLACCPHARFRFAPGLRERVPGLPPGEAVDDHRPSTWTNAIEHAVLRPRPEVSEVALFHVASSTVILTDLAFHLVRFERVFDRIAWRLSGVPPRFGPSMSARVVLLRDRTVTSQFLQRVVAWPFRRVLVAHGEPLEDDAQNVFRRAFASYRAA